VEKELQQLAKRLIREKRKKRKTRVLISVLSFFVILGTFYAWTLPAITYEKESPDGAQAINQEAVNRNDTDAAAVVQNAGSSGAAVTAVIPAAESPDPITAAEPAASTEAAVAAEPAPSAGTTAENTDLASAAPAAATGETTATAAPAESAAATTTTAVPTAPTDKTSQASRTEYIYAENGLKVTATLSAPGAIPDEAKLSVKRITAQNDSEQYQQYRQLLQDSRGSADSTVFSAYDISFLLNGQEVEPQTGSTVNVVIEDSVAPLAASDNLQVFHVIEAVSKPSELKEIPAKTTDSSGAPAITFTADSFSAYVVAQPAIPANSSLSYKLIDDAADTFTHTNYYDASQILGIAGNFHIVAFDTATLNSHTNGNILARQLVANVNFGTNNLANELSYAQSYTKVHSTSAARDSDVLALGSENTVTLTNNGYSFAINGTKLDRPKNVWQDADTATQPFIDLAQVKSEISAVAATIGQLETINIASNLNSGGSCDASYLALTEPDKVGVFNISASDLSSYSYLGIKGFQSGHDGTVIINVDCNSAPATLNLPVCEMYVDNNKQNFKEVTNFVNGRVIWNFGDYSGTITTNLMYATVIAPDATINVNQNLNGTIIGKNVTINAESHRDDFVGRLSNGETVTLTKHWLGNDGSELAADALTGIEATFQLYQSVDGEDAEAAVGDPVTLNKDTGWTTVWSDLPTGYTYSVQETAVTKEGEDVSAKYQTTYGASCLNSGTLSVTNQIIYTLPNSGGSGTSGITIAGLILMGTALYKFRKTRRPATRGR
jgi:LPXTG-motif cell wall-anchored protein